MIAVNVKARFGNMKTRLGNMGARLGKVKSKALKCEAQKVFFKSRQNKATAAAFA